MVVTPSVGLILLAAGGSSRLGRPKQLLDYEGQPLLRRAVETALASQCFPVIVVLGAEAEACAAMLEGLGGSLRLVVNADWKEGLSSSIRTGLTVLEKENSHIAAAILSVADQPHLTAGLLDSLIEHHRFTGKKIIAAQYAGVPGPPALFDLSLFPQLKTLSGDEGARRVLQENPGEVVLVPFPAGSLDVDTPEDYEKLRLQS
jgi:molybdenum cofactor cytidylyltransferase